MKSKITMSINWVGFMLIAMGILFLFTGIIVSIFAVNELADDEIFLFRAVFLGMFGTFGLTMLAIGGIILGRAYSRKKMQKRLVEDGNYCWAQIVDVSPDYMVRINGRSPLVLRCKYTHNDSQTYIFKSGYLRYDPRSFFADGRIKVWFNRENIKQYFVDVEDTQAGFVEL